MDVESLGYLERLTLRLTIGAANLPQQIQQLHARYILDLQRADGGWAGREGESDLYYTSFALRSLAILGLLEGDLAQRATNFLRERFTSHQTVVDLLSLVYSAKLIDASCGISVFDAARPDWARRLAELLDTFRRPDGGYSKSIEGQAGSTYQTFLILLCHELIEQPISHPDQIAQFLLAQRQADGGFLEVRVAKRSGTNPTAAAVGALRVLNRLDSQIANNVAHFISQLQSDEGGLQANTRIPMPDLLSTFTGCVTLADLDQIDSIDCRAAYDFGLQMQRPAGGFYGFELDPGEDVEYTFYGLGLLALLQ